MFTRGVLPDLRRRLEEEGTGGVISSRVIRTWGMSESGLAELLSARIEALGAGIGTAARSDTAPGSAPGSAPDTAAGKPTIAFLASGIEGIKVRITAKAPDEDAAAAMLDAEEALVRELAGEVVFGVDGDTMESVVAQELARRGLSLGIAESLTGGLVASRLVGIPGASDWFRGSVVAYWPEAKFSILGVPEGPVVTQAAAKAMAEGARGVLGADIGLALTGVAGPDPSEGQPPGTVMIALAFAGRDTESIEVHLPGDRDRVRQYATISALDLLRRRIHAHWPDDADSPASARSPASAESPASAGSGAEQVHV